MKMYNLHDMTKIVNDNDSEKESTITTTKINQMEYSPAGKTFDTIQEAINTVRENNLNIKPHTAAITADMPTDDGQLSQSTVATKPKRTRRVAVIGNPVAANAQPVAATAPIASNVSGLEILKNIQLTNEDWGQLNQPSIIKTGTHVVEIQGADVWKNPNNPSVSLKVNFKIMEGECAGMRITKFFQIIDATGRPSNSLKFFKNAFFLGMAKALFGSENGEIETETIFRTNNLHTIVSRLMVYIADFKEKRRFLKITVSHNVYNDKLSAQIDTYRF